MKLQILSDLHNEFLRDADAVPSHLWLGKIPETDADVIILAGDIDIGVYGIDWMIDESERLNKPIVYVLGNHEFYKHEYFSLKQEINDKCNGSNVYLLDCDTFELNGVRLLGLTLWTDYLGDRSIPQDLAMFYAGRDLADHKLIKFNASGSFSKFKPMDACSIHESEKRWLLDQLNRPFQGKTVVVSHHAPHPVCIHPAYPNSVIGTAFYSDLDALIMEHEIDLWVYGHTHANLDATIYNTRIVSNQAGYPGEHVEDFDPSYMIDIG